MELNLSLAEGECSFCHYRPSEGVIEGVSATGFDTSGEQTCGECFNALEASHKEAARRLAKGEVELPGGEA